MRRIIATGLLAALSCTGCATSPAEAQKPGLHVIPISNVVRPLKPVDGALDWLTVVQSHLTRQPVYDSVFRRPAGPVSPVIVHCDTTRSVGIYIEVHRDIPEREALRPLRFTWTYLQSSDNKPARSTFRQAWYAAMAQGVLVYSDMMLLSKERRIDGEWQVAVFHFGEEIYRQSFMLMDCDKPYAPEWFEEEVS